ncbi:MAG: VacJ lipoprotein [Rhodobacteraceae bacterium]|nr:VacJ lipoprotein [Paracoccaceae bacterium]
MIAALPLMAACTKVPDGATSADGVFDPYENQNRAVHDLNLTVDKYAFRPAGIGFSTVVPDPMEDSIGYFADNLGMPKVMINALLQGDFENFGWALARFLMNSTIGGFGLSDPASEFGIPVVDKDFGQTLDTWGFKEGAYLELPFYGPSTERDTVGIMVDIWLNPFSFIGGNTLGNATLYSNGGQMLSDRGRYSDTIDSVLYDSADSYAQSRLIYLQNRRFELGSDGTGNAFDPYDDPYADPYADPYGDPGAAAPAAAADPYSDPYEDPYALQ